jgi:hypothetical protein
MNIYIYDLSKLTFTRWDLFLKHLQNEINFVIHIVMKCIGKSRKRRQNKKTLTKQTKQNN